jgi:hypothetical protein
VDARYCELQATKQLSPELSEVMDTVTKTVNYIKTRPLKSRFFVELCEEMRSQYQPLLFYSNSRCLPRGSVVARLYNLREGVALFLEDENLVDADYFRNRYSFLN